MKFTYFGYTVNNGKTDQIIRVRETEKCPLKTIPERCTPSCETCDNDLFVYEHYGTFVQCCSECGTHVSNGERRVPDHRPSHNAIVRLNCFTANEKGPYRQNPGTEPVYNTVHDTLQSLVASFRHSRKFATLQEIELRMSGDPFCPANETLNEFCDRVLMEHPLRRVFKRIKHRALSRAWTPLQGTPLPDNPHASQCSDDLP